MGISKRGLAVPGPPCNGPSCTKTGKLEGVACHEEEPAKWRRITLGRLNFFSFLLALPHLPAVCVLTDSEGEAKDSADFAEPTVGSQRCKTSGQWRFGPAGEKLVGRQLATTH